MGRMESIGRYKLVRKIGAGGMAEVFLARAIGAQGTEKQLVIKKIHPALSQNAKFIDMFVDEAHVAIRLNHTNIVQVYSFEHDGDAYILAMEYVDGTDLLRFRNVVRGKNRRMPFGLAAYIASEIAKGLDYAHSRCDENGEALDIVHRDVSPQNILISHEGAAKIADFGIARARWLNEEVGAVKGKFGYMSPEQAEGEPVDRRADIYALGLVLYELLINRQLFKFKQGEDPRDIICSTRHPAPSEIEPSIPLALNDVVVRATAFDPSDRYATARDMAGDLARYLHSEKELYDAQALEAFMKEFGADLASPVSGPGDKSETVSSFADAPTKIAGGKGEKRPSVQNALSTTEKKTAVVVAGRYEIDDTDTKFEEVAAALLRLIGEMAYKWNGVLRKGDHSFSIFMGLAQASMEDAITAVRLAYDVLDAARALSRDNRVDINVKLGVCQGSVHLQVGGERAIKTFEADDSLVSRCEALTDAAADGEILADSQIYKLGRREYHFKRVRFDNAAINKGETIIDERPSAYRVQGTRSRQERTESVGETGTFHGRRQELDNLRRAFLQVKQGAPRIYRLSGEMGIGKSRLVAEFVGQEAAAAEVLSVDCLFAERDRPMAAAADALRSVLCVGEGETGGVLRKSLESVFELQPRYRERQTAFFKEFLAAPDRVWAKNPTMRRALVQRTAFGLGVVLSIQARKQPVILLVENAHWLDGPSIDVLSELAHERPPLPIMVLLIGQPNTLAGRKIAHLREMEVGEMSDRAVREIILGRLGTSEGIKSIAEQIVRRSHGNPFFANEMVDSLIEQKIVQKVKGKGTIRYRQARPGTIRLPATMQGIAASRIAALPPDQRIVLRAASAIGASFDEETVGALVGRVVRDEIRALTQEGLLVQNTVEDGVPIYRFSQPMVREVAYGGLEERDRRRIHRIIAQRLVADLNRGRVVPEVRIAWHLELAGENEEAGRRYVAAANSAAAIYSDRESLKLYDRAIPLIRPNSKERFEALAEREQVLRYLGRFAEREAENREMRRIAGLLDNDLLSARSLNRQAQLSYDLGDYDSAARTLIESLEVTRRSGDTVSQVEALRLMAYVAIQGGHLFRAVDCANRALSVIKDKSETAFLMKALTLDVKGFALHQMGYLDDSAPPLAESLVLFRKLGSHRNESQVMHHLARLAWARGEMVEAVQFLEQAIRIDSRVRAARPRGLKLAAMGDIRLDIGDFQGAFENLEDAKRICKDNQEQVGLAETELALARLNIIEKRFKHATDILEQLSDRAVVTRSRIFLVWHRQMMVEALMGEGRINAARKLVDEAARIALESGMNGEAVHSGVLQALVLAEVGEHREAVSAARRASDMLVMLRKVRNAEQVWWQQALTFQKTGDTYLAKRALADARLQVDKKLVRLQHTRYLEMYKAHPLTRAILSATRTDG